MVIDTHTCQRITEFAVVINADGSPLYVMRGSRHNCLARAKIVTEDFANANETCLVMVVRTNDNEVVFSQAVRS